jgi:hypothetical protein
MKKQPQTPDLEAQAKRLRASTCEALGLKRFDKLSPADQILVDRVAMLRLQVDDARMAQLRGQPINVAAFIEASEELERIMRRRAVDTSPAGEFGDAQAEFIALIERHAAAQKIVDDKEKARVKAEIDALRADNERLRKQAPAPPPALPNPLPENVTKLTPEEKPNKSPTPPPPAEPFYRAEPPAAYLRGPPEPWRNHVSPFGDITAGPRMTGKDWGPI